MKKWSFGIDNDSLISIVLSGKKKATTSEYDAANLPVIGEESIIQFTNGKDACVVKTVDYKIMKFKDMTEELAKLEGEGDLSLTYWKNVHLDFFKSYDSNFNEDSLIVFEIFQLTRNLVEERMELAKKIGNANLELFQEIKSIEEINAGFRNTLFQINNKYIIKICTNKKLEKTFEKEYEFYKLNQNNRHIPKLYKYDSTKKDIDYTYEILEKVNGNTLYYYWYKMDEKTKESTIQNLIEIIKEIHSIKEKDYDWASYIKTEIKNRILSCKDIFSKEDYDCILNSINKYDEYLKDNKFSLIHNDFHFDNVIYNNGELKIIDFNDVEELPIDFEFRQIYMCQYSPWKWANIEMDSYQKIEDYKNIWTYTKKYYEELNTIPYLEERMIIYKILEETKHLSKSSSKELINDIIKDSKKLI